jgi:hypothetical protein
MNTMPGQVRLPTPRRTTVQVAGNGIVLLCTAFVTVGALFFGIASCGGYVWHKEFFRFAGFTLCLLAVSCPSTLLPGLRSKVLFALALPMGFVLLESAVAPFYPGPPASVAEYGLLFLHALQFDPCA